MFRNGKELLLNRFIFGFLSVRREVFEWSKVVELFSSSFSADPTTAQYRTVPWRPYNVTFDEDKIGPDFFEVRWSGPREITEFDRYQVRMSPTLGARDGHHCLQLPAHGTFRTRPLIH